jgi:hypothetical protein
VVRNEILMSVALAGLFGISACEATAEPPSTAPRATPPGSVDAGTGGTVVETMNAGGYTYVRVDTGDEQIWAAAPEFRVAVGDHVVVPTELPMRDHYSKTLDRTFDLVYYAGAIRVMGSEQGVQEPGKIVNPHATGIRSAPAVEPDVSGIERPEGGRTIEELFAEKDELAGTEVLVRGKVVKFSSGIMGKNWVHLRDGTGLADSNDLTVTTDVRAKVNDTVLVRGTLTTGRDFGFGYQYDIIIEDAEVTVE